MATSKKLSVIDTTGRPTVSAATVATPTAPPPIWAEHKDKGFALSSVASNGDQTYTPTYAPFNNVANPRTHNVGSVKVVGKNGGKMDIKIVKGDGSEEDVQKDASTDDVHNFLNKTVGSHNAFVLKQQGK